MITVKTPDEIYGDLFHLVQSTHVFPDSKTFVDATPKADPESILDDFRQSARREDFDILDFVAGHFDLPRDEDVATAPETIIPVRDRIENLWDELTREADRVDPHSSLIALPRPYVVPGGRFREIYYWDSYFTMLGLAESGRISAIEDMVANFAFLIDEIGFIPNGNRSYFCSRSQPPFFVLMVELLSDIKNDRGIFARYSRQLNREYEFWMSGSDSLDADHVAARRVVAVDGGLLNRHWDDADTPRQEGYAEDIQLAEHTDREAASLYRDVRAACESGWDFSSRWFADDLSMSTIHTSEILPVDLNSLLFKLESVLSGIAGEQGNDEAANRFAERAGHRKRLLRTLFYDERVGIFSDLTLPGLVSTGTHSLAAAYPLYFGIAAREQATNVARCIHERFLRPGGWVTTLNDTGQQWDSPNGWAPLHWIVYQGMKNYGCDAEAEAGARNWVENNLAVYAKSGRLLEKYNVEEIGVPPTGGEYAAQDGFGWTNAVLLKLMQELHTDET